MTDCKCHWDGALDGKIIRCTEHKARYDKERRARKEAQKTYEEWMNK